MLPDVALRHKYTETLHAPDMHVHTCTYPHPHKEILKVTFLCLSNGIISSLINAQISQTWREERSNGVTMETYIDHKEVCFLKI